METIKPGKYVELVYKVTATGADGDVFTMDFTEQRPDRFVYGVEKGLIEQLETSLLDMKEGDTFDLTLAPADTLKEFGERDENAVMHLNKSIFVIDGKFDSNTVAVGKVLPMMTEDGYQVQGMVIDITDDKVVMDFNHPFAGKTVSYVGHVKTVRDATPEDLPQSGCGCGCGHDHHHHDDGCGGCGCDDCGGCH